MQCSQKTGQQLRLKEKKKKKRENADAARLSAIQTYTNYPSCWCEEQLLGGVVAAKSQ